MPFHTPILRIALAASLFTTARLASASIMSYTPITGDADSGISEDLTYTAKADFNGTGSQVVNNVSFTDNGYTGTGYSLSGPDGNVVGGSVPNNVTGGVGGLVNDFYYGATSGPDIGNATLTLTGLTVGEQYVTTWYNRAWENPGGRVVFITPSDSPSGAFRIDQNFSGSGNGNVIRYSFTATDVTQTYSFNAAVDGNSFHHYAFSNTVRNDAALPLVASPVAPQVSSQSGVGPQVGNVSNADLLQTSLASVSLSGTAPDPEGSGGVAALTDGHFVSGPGLFSEYLTPNVGTSVTFSLDVSNNTFGYDVSSVQGFGGWQDGGRDRQNYSLYYSVVGDDNFTFLGTVDFDAILANGESSLISSIFNTALTGVDGIRVDFLDPQENTHSGYGEFDVIGTPTIPEPGSVLLSLGAAPLLLRRRRRS